MARLGALLMVVAAAAVSFASEAPRPNIVLILADDLGYGDLSSYGATDLATPHIDRLAREGVRFTDFYSAGNTCSPSRAALMTGRYPFRSGVNAVLFYDTPEGLPQSEITLAELLRDAGYATCMVGKWHLGSTDEFMPLQHGFSEFFGVPYSNDERNFFLFDGAHRIQQAVDLSQLTRRYTDRALDFLERAAHADRPFFLYVAYNAPHVPLDPGKGFAGRSHRGTYGDVVEELDASVGEILGRLTTLGIDDHTIVIFTSDNGPWLAMRDWGGRAGPLRGGKTSTFEGGHRVPALVRWPGRAPTTEVHDVATMMDWFPTLAELAGARLPDDRPIDGRSLVAVLRGTGAREATPFYYLQLRTPFIGDQGREIGAVRVGRWKLKRPQRGYPQMLEPFVQLEFFRHGLMLFDLEADPGEQHDVAAAHPDVVARLTQQIEAFEASAVSAPPVRVSAAPGDPRGWKRLAPRIGALFGATLGALALGLLALVWAIRLVRRARRR